MTRLSGPIAAPAGPAVAQWRLQVRAEARWYHYVLAWVLVVLVEGATLLYLGWLRLTDAGRYRRFRVELAIYHDPSSDDD